MRVVVHSLGSVLSVSDSGIESSAFITFRTNDGMVAVGRSEVPVIALVRTALYHSLSLLCMLIHLSLRGLPAFGQ